MPLRISMVSLRPTVYRSCNDAMFADPNYSAVFLRMRWDERAKAYGRGRGERRLRTGGARVRPVRTTCSDVETASRASLWASAEGTRATNSLLRGAVPAHANISSGAATVLSDHPKHNAWSTPSSAVSSAYLYQEHTQRCTQGLGRYVVSSQSTLSRFG